MKQGGVGMQLHVQKSRGERKPSVLEEVKTVSMTAARSMLGSKHEAGGVGRGQTPGASGAVLGRAPCRQDGIQCTPSKDHSGCWVEKRLDEEGRREGSCLEAVAESRWDMAVIWMRAVATGWGKGSSFKRSAVNSHGSFHCAAKGRMGGAATTLLIRTKAEAPTLR